MFKWLRNLAHECLSDTDAVIDQAIAANRAKPREGMRRPDRDRMNQIGSMQWVSIKRAQERSMKKVARRKPRLFSRKESA